MIYVESITHIGQVPESFKSIEEVRELGRKLQTLLSWHFGSVKLTIDENENKISFRIADKDSILLTLDEAEKLIKGIRDALKRIEEQA